MEIHGLCLQGPWVPHHDQIKEGICLNRLPEVGNLAAGGEEPFFFFRAFSVWRFFGAIPGTSHTSLDWGSEFFGGTVGSFLAKKGFVRW